MASTTPGYLDGNYAAPVLSKNVVSFPLSDKPGNEGTACFELTYFQWANTFASAALGSTSTDAPLANLYMQGPLERVGVVRFIRYYCQQPVTWYEMEQVSYTYPGLDSGVGTTNWVAFGARSAITMQKVATIKHEYTINANIPTASIQQVTVITLNGQPINRIGQWFYGNSVLTVPTTDPSVYIISSDAQRWKGNMWEIITKQVTRANVSP